MSIVDNLRNFVARKPSPPICFSSIPPHELISVTCYEFSPKDTEGSDLPKFVMRSRLVIIFIPYFSSVSDVFSLLLNDVGT